MQTLGTGAAKLNLEFQIGSTRDITFTFTESDGTDTDISLWTFEFFIKRFAGDRLKTFSLTLGAGLSFPVYMENELLAEISASNSSIEEGEYYWELRRTDENISLINGNAYFSFEAETGDINSVDVTSGSQTVAVTIYGAFAASASQSEVNAGTVTNKYVSPATLAAKALKSGIYSTELTFDTDKDIYQDVSTPTFTLAASGNINGVGIILRLNTPTSVNFPANFEAHPNSATLDATKLNVYTLVYFSNWNGSGTARVIYNNSLFTAI